MDDKLTSKTKILFHVGLHKTGSTTLQKELFHPEFGFIQDPRGRRFYLPIFVDKFSTQWLNNLDKKEIHRFAKFAKDRGCLPVLSNERFSGYPASGGYDRLSIYSRISQLRTEFEVKILFVIREQYSWMVSAWKQTIMDGGYTSFREFVSPSHAAPPCRVALSRTGNVNYENERRVLDSFFGSENVLMYPYELIFESFAQFHGRLASVCGLESLASPEFPPISHNKGVNLGAVYFLRFLNRYLLASTTSPDALISADSKFGAKIHATAKKIAKNLPELPIDYYLNRRLYSQLECVLGRYSESNSKFAKATGIDLARLGYECN